MGYKIKRFATPQEEEMQNPIPAPQATSRDLQIENMRLQRELMRNNRIRQELTRECKE